MKIIYIFQEKIMLNLDSVKTLTIYTKKEIHQLNAEVKVSLDQSLKSLLMRVMKQNHPMTFKEFSGSSNSVIICQMFHIF